MLGEGWQFGTVINVINEGVSRGIWTKDSAKICAFIEELMITGDAADRIRISELLDTHEDCVEAFPELKYRLVELVVEDLSDNIDDLVKESEILDDFDHVKHISKAQSKLREYIDERLSEYRLDFPKTAAEDIFRKCNLEDLIYRNFERRMDSYPDIPAGNHDKQLSDEAHIDHLFNGMSRPNY